MDSTPSRSISGKNYLLKHTVRTVRARVKPRFAIAWT